MKKVRYLEPIVSKEKFVDFYGTGKIIYEMDVITLFDCGTPTARIVRGTFQLLLLHPETDLEWALIRDFAWQHGFEEFAWIKPAEARKKYGVYPYSKGEKGHVNKIKH